MREKVPYKLDGQHKAFIIASAIEGKTIEKTANDLRMEFGLDVSDRTVWSVRSKAAKRIAKALDDQLNRAVALSPLATLENRMLTLERVVQEGFADLEQAKAELSSDEELNPEQESFIRLKGIRSLQAVNDAIKIADAAMHRMLSVRQKMLEYNSKNNLGTRDLVEETIMTVQKRVYQADEKRVIKQADMADLTEDVDWLEDDDLND